MQVSMTHMPWLLLPLLVNPSWMVVAMVLDMEAPMTWSWLEGDWSTENLVSESVMEDEASGCICRWKMNQHVVCYGASTCNSFPMDVALPPGIVDLRVKTTGIKWVRVDDLQYLTSLQYLEIDANNQLSYLEPGVFAKMSNLTNLSVSFNSDLKFLNESVFEGLDNLRRLRLIKNGFDNIWDVSFAFSPTYLPSLESLSLSENYFRYITEAAFSHMNGTNVKELDLILCQIEQIEPKALLLFKKLEKLRLGENLLSASMLESLFTEMSSTDTPLKLLNLYGLGLRKGSSLNALLKVIARLPVVHLVLARNHIEYLYEGLFPFMGSITTLDLRDVSALEMSPNCLGEKYLPNLQVLLLGGNKLPGPVQGTLLPQLAELDLSMNSGKDNFQSYFDVNSNTFQNMSKLTSLNLSFNRITTISNITFQGMNNLNILGLKNATIYHIAENSLAMLQNLYLLNLEDNPFQPFNKFQELIFQGLERLAILLLSNCKITYFRRADIFKPLVNLKYLSLKDNALMRADPNVFRPLVSLVGLELSNNLLRPWGQENRLFASHPHLKILLLTNNRFTYLTRTMMDDFYPLVRLDLADNPYVCDCTFFNRTVSWLDLKNLRVNETSLLGPGTLCVSPEGWRDKTVVQFIEASAESCLIAALNERTSIVLYTALGFALFLLVTLLVLCYFYRWYIRYWIFLTKMAYIRHHGFFNKDRKPPTGDFKYDAFVSYSHEDRNFIVRLVAMLENHEPYLKLCVYERDFEIGTVISETVMKKVESSRRTLLIVSDAFARSQWCMWELQIAECHRLFFRDKSHDDSLVIIKLGSIADSHITPTLRYLMRTRIYLEWNAEVKKQRVFWEKLRNCVANK